LNILIVPEVSGVLEQFCKLLFGTDAGNAQSECEWKASIEYFCVSNPLLCYEVWSTFVGLMEGQEAILTTEGLFLDQYALFEVSNRRELILQNARRNSGVGIKHCGISKQRMRMNDKQENENVTTYLNSPRKC